MNLNYSTILDKYTRIERWFWFASFNADYFWNDQLEPKVRKWYFTKYPRRKKFNFDKACGEFETEILEFRLIVQRRFKALLEARTKQLELLNGLLNTLAPEHEGLTEEWNVVKQSAFSAYRSQGMGMEYYTRKALEPYQEMLRVDGVDTYLEKGEVSYILYAKCTKEHFDAVVRRTSVNQIDYHKANGVNHKVFYPFAS